MKFCINSENYFKLIQIIIAISISISIFIMASKTSKNSDSETEIQYSPRSIEDTSEVSLTSPNVFTPGLSGPLQSFHFPLQSGEITHPPSRQRNLPPRRTSGKIPKVDILEHHLRGSWPPKVLKSQLLQE